MKQISTNEVIKALTECFPNDHRFVTIYNGHTGETTCVTLQDILDIFNNQEAAIERLRSMNQAKLDTIHDLRAELEIAKAEAVKEVFEKIDERLAVHSFTSNSTEYSDGMLDCLEWVDSKIDELKKEMVGEDK